MVACAQEESFCPTVSFSKISLEGGSPFWGTDYSITMGTVAASGIHDSLHITIEAAIQEIDSGGLTGGWLNDEILAPYLKVKAIQVTESAWTAHLLNSANMSELVLGYGDVGWEFVSEKDKSITDIFQELEARYNEDYHTLRERFKTNDSDGNVVWNIPLWFEFDIEDTSNPEHLTYFIFSYYDFTSPAPGLSTMQLPVDLERVNGNIEYRRVIEDSAIAGRADHTRQGQYRLQHDSVVQDFRIIDRLEGLQNFNEGFLAEYGPTPLQDLGAVSRFRNTKLLTNDNLDIVRNTAYFSDFLVTRGNSGAANFFFSLDFRKVILENAVFGKYFLGSFYGPGRAFIERTIDDIMNKTEIISLKIKRKRVNPLPGVNKIGGAIIDKELFDKNGIEETIAELSGDDSSKGFIKEIDVIGVSLTDRIDDYRYIKQFTGTDTDVLDQTHGHFQYIVEMEIKDGTIDFFVDKYNDLLDARSPLDEYINILNIPGVYDPEARTRQHSDYSVTAGTVLWHHGGGQWNDIDLLDRYQVLALPIIEKYFDCVTTLLNENPETAADNMEAVAAITNPDTKDSRGILMFSRLVDNLLKRMEVMIDSVNASTVRSFSQSSPSGTPKRTFKLQKHFVELFDSNLSTDIGFDYLSNTATSRSETFEGLKVYSIGALTTRLNQEILKYYHTLNEEIETEFSFARREDQDLSIRRDDAPIYFSPAQLLLGSSQYSFLGRGDNLWAPWNNDLSATEILSYKKACYLSDWNIDSHVPLPDYLQKTKYNLLKMFEAFNLTMPEPSLIYDRGYLDSRDRPTDELASVRDTLDATGPDWTPSTQLRERSQRVLDPMAYLNPNPFLTKLTSGFALSSRPTCPPGLASDRGGEIPTPQRRWSTEEKFDIGRLNPDNNHGIWAAPDTPPPGWDHHVGFWDWQGTRVQEFFRDMPLQFKSIIAHLGTSLLQTSLAGGDRRLDTATFPLPDFTQEHKNAFIFNFLLLQGVEYLSGYGRSIEDGVQIKRPIWQTATISRLRAYGRDEILCRLRRFEHNLLPSVKPGEGLDMPSYNNYFIVRIEGGDRLD